MKNELQTNILNQIEFLRAERYRVKQSINQNNFDCTTAAFRIVRDYRKALADQISVLTENLED